MSDELTAWADKWQSAVDVLTHPLRDLIEPPAPANDDPAERLQVLLRVRASLNLDDSARSPVREAAEALAATVYASFRRPDLLDRLTEVATRLDRDISGLIDRLPAEQRTDLIRTADFARTRMITLPHLTEASALAGQPQSIWFCCAEIDSLPQGHPLRSLLPETEAYLADRLPDRAATRCLILGRNDSNLNGNSLPRAFYSLDSAKRWTLHFVTKQREADAEAVERLRQEKAREEAAFWESDIGKALLAERQLAAMKARGLVPPELPKAEPTVRIGR